MSSFQLENIFKLKGSCSSTLNDESQVYGCFRIDLHRMRYISANNGTYIYKIHYNSGKSSFYFFSVAQSEFVALPKIFPCNFGIA